MEENNVENQEIHGFREKGQNSQQQIVGAIIVAGIIIAGAILLKGSQAPTTGGSVINNAKNTDFLGRPVSPDDHIFGNKDAKIVIVEYSDLECPYCKAFHSTMHKVVENNTNVAWVYRHYPIPQLHPKAFHEAEATECAFAQGGNDAFWRYIDRVFEITESNNKLDVAELPKIAEYIGLDVVSFNTCLLQKGENEKKVQQDVDDGAKAGVTGTPSSFILVKGKLVDTIPGAQPYETVIQKLSQIK